MSKKLLFALMLAVCVSACSYVEDEQSVTTSTVVESKSTARLMLNDKNEVESYLDSLSKSEGVSSLKSANLSTLRSSMSLKTVGSGEFVSLLDYERNKVLSTLTAEQLAEVEAEGLVYIPEDSIIFDSKIASLVNYKREIQVGETIYKYTEEGTYSVDPTAEEALAKIDNGEDISSYLEAGTVQFEEWNYTDESTNSATKSGSTYAGKDLVLQDGRVINAEDVRDLNFNDKGDQSSVNNIINRSRKGKSITAINQFRKGRKMLVTFRDQYVKGLLKTMGVEVKMQRRKFGIWFGTDADNMVIGWGVMELVNAPRADENQTFDNTQLYILKKDFPFYKGYTFFCVPNVNYTSVNYDYLATYKRGMNLFGRNIPSWLSYESTAAGIYLPGDHNKLEPILLLCPRENQQRGRNKIEENLSNDWFKGTYEFSYRNNTGRNQFSATVKPKDADNIHIGRTAVYGAVLYERKWKAARIVKDN